MVFVRRPPPFTLRLVPPNGVVLVGYLSLFVYLGRYFVFPSPFAQLPITETGETGNPKECTSPNPATSVVVCVCVNRRAGVSSVSSASVNPSNAAMHSPQLLPISHSSKPPSIAGSTFATVGSQMWWSPIIIHPPAPGSSGCTSCTHVTRVKPRIIGVVVCVDPGVVHDARNKSAPPHRSAAILKGLPSFSIEHKMV